MQLSVKECLSFAWNTFKARPWILLSATAIVFLAEMILSIPNSIISSYSSGNPSILGFVVSILTMAISFVFIMGKTAFFLRAHDNPELVELKELWHPRPYWKFLGVSALAGAAVVIGLLIFVVPGIIIGVMTCFCSYIVIEQKRGPISAIKESARITKGNRWTLFLLGLALLVINIIGFCVLLVGLLVSLPISSLAVVHAYRALQRKMVEGDTVIA